MRAWWARVTALFSRNRIDEDLAAEVDAHLRMAAEANVDRGMAPTEALEAARRGFGNRTLIRESARETWTFHGIETLTQDVRYAWRSLMKNPGFTVVTLLSLTLGIGANTAIFSLINALMIRPLPGVDQPDRLVRLTNGNYSYLLFETLESHRVFANTVAFTQTRTPAAVNGVSQWTQTELVSGDYFAALGVRPMLGRTLSPERRTQPRGSSGAQSRLLDPCLLRESRGARKNSSDQSGEPDDRWCDPAGVCWSRGRLPDGRDGANHTRSQRDDVAGIRRPHQ